MGAKESGKILLVIGIYCINKQAGVAPGFSLSLVGFGWVVLRLGLEL